MKNSIHPKLSYRQKLEKFYVELEFHNQGYFPKQFQNMDILLKSLRERDKGQFFFFLREEKGDSHVTVIISRPTVQLGKPIDTTNSNWSSKTLNPHTPQALLVSGISRNCNYSPRENSNLGCNEASTVTHQLYHTCWWSLYDM